MATGVGEDEQDGCYSHIGVKLFAVPHGRASFPKKYYWRDMAL